MGWRRGCGDRWGGGGGVVTDGVKEGVWGWRRGCDDRWGEGGCVVTDGVEEGV